MKIHALKNGQVIYTKSAEEKDSKEIIHMLNEVGHETDYLSYRDYNMSDEQFKQYINYTNSTYDDVFLIAVLDDKIIGNLAFNRERRIRMNHNGEIGLSVLKAYWGLGIGSILLNELIEYLKLSGEVKKINLTVREDNENAIKLYEKFGFKVEGKLEKHICIDKMYYNSLIMSKYTE